MSGSCVLPTEGWPLGIVPDDCRSSPEAFGRKPRTQPAVPASTTTVIAPTVAPAPPKQTPSPPKSTAPKQDPTSSSLVSKITSTLKQPGFPCAKGTFTVTAGGWPKAGITVTVTAKDTVTSYLPYPSSLADRPGVNYTGTLVSKGPICSVTNSTQTSFAVYDATSIKTITQTPAGVITVYYDSNGQLSTLGLTTLYEVAVYQTAVENNLVIPVTRCEGQS
ncbi:hypothetical protein EJ08DRAFT_651530 [Tothia fuscella]|uniref:Uncharacterized protein n=1 Tax=Tothia fuscella TaxID=1048955 RepID=A0A9P4NLX8_9PEZI|nr:hypothetical protein EJ08DRAFT_651530 [Tothia fuscella]